MILTNGQIILPNKILSGYNLYIEDIYIKKIYKKNNQNLKNKKIIDCKNNYISPGFIDIHNHGNSGYDFMDCNNKSISKIAKYHLKNGVTSYLATIITSPIEKMIDVIKFLSYYKEKSVQSKMIGIHLEGPFINKAKDGAHNKRYIKSPSYKYIKQLLSIPDEKIKMVSLAPELKNSKMIIQYLVKLNKKVAMAHTKATYEEAISGFNFGISIITHLYNAMSEFQHRKPGAVGASLIDDRVYCELIYDRIHLHDMAVNLAIRAKGTDKIILVSDAIRATGMKDGIYELGGQDVYVKKGIAKLEDGSLAGSTVNIKESLKNMYRYQDVKLYEAINMVSLNPAKALGIDENIGSIQTGKIADLLIFDTNFNIKKIILNGNLV